MRKTLLAAAAALGLASSAQAASIQDLRSLGYSVSIVSQSQNCKLWVARGFGTSTRLGCEGTSGFQTAVDAMATPQAACDAKWQFNHHDQRSAVSQIGQAGYVVTGDECGDSYTVTNRFTKKVVYSGGSAGLVALASRLGSAGPGGIATAVLASTCLPLCTAVVPAPTGSKTVSSGRASLTVTVSLADVKLALEKRDKASVNPLLSSAVSSALGRKLVVSADTACTIRQNPLDCSRLFNLISNTQVTVTFKGSSASEIGLPVPKVKQNPARGSTAGGGG